eukprot:g15379.t2
MGERTASCMRQQEVRRPGRTEFTASGFRVFTCGTDRGGGSHGVGIAVEKALCKASRYTTEYVDERLMAMRCEMTGHRGAVNFVAAYSPKEVADASNKQLFWDKLDSLVGRIPAKEGLFVLMDANAQTGSKIAGEDEGTMGEFGRNELNDNGRRLLTFATDNRPAVLNIFCDKRRDGIWRTYNGPAGDDATRGQQFVTDENGVLLRNKDAILKRWRRFFDTLLNYKSPTLNPDIVELVAQRPTTRTTRRLAAVPDPEEVEATTNGLGNWKAVGPNLLAAELLKVDGDVEPIFREHLRAIFVEVWNGGEMPLEWKDATIKDLGRRRRIPLYMCFIDRQKAYDSVDRELLWKVLARAGIPAEMIAVIRKFHVGMRARVGVDDGELSDWFPVTQGLRQGCSISPLLFNVFAAPLEVIVTRFSQDEVIMRDLVYLEDKAGGGGGTRLDRVRRAVWGMLNADDAGTVSKSAEDLARMMTVIVEVLREFGLTVSERKTETLVMRVKEKQPPLMPPPPLIIEAAGQRYAQKTEFPYLGGIINEQGDLTREIRQRSKAAWACFKRYKTELFYRPGAPFDLKARLLKAEAVEALLYGCVTWSPRHDHYRLLQTTHHQLLLRIIGHLRKRGTHRQLSYAQALRRVGCQSVETTTRQRRLFFAGAVARQPDKRLPKQLMFGELAGGEKPGKGSPEQNWLTCLEDDLRVFGATHGSTDEAPCVFGVPKLVWSEAAKVEGG